MSGETTGRILSIWLVSAVVMSPLAGYAVYRARRAGVSTGRQIVTVVLLVLAAPLGIGVWLGVLAGAPSRSRNRS